MLEQDLIKAAIKRDQKAQTALFDQYKSYWYMICLRYNKNRFDADDCLQNALVNIFYKIDQFNEEKGNFKSWSSKIVVNENLAFLRSKNHFAEIIDLSEAEQREVSTERLDDPLSQENLTALVQKLPDGYRSVFNLYVLEGYTHKEIAGILKISVGTSKSQLFKARKMLQAELEVVI